MKKIIDATVEAIRNYFSRGAAKEQPSSPTAATVEKQTQPAFDMQAAMDKSKADQRMIDAIQGFSRNERTPPEGPAGGTTNDNSGNTRHRSIEQDKPLPNGVQPPEPPKSLQRGRDRGMSL